MMVPTVIDPPGDPTALRAAAQRLTNTAAQIRETASRMAASNVEAARAWESSAQRMFDLLNAGYAGLMTGTASIAADFAMALDRYAVVLDSCQSETRAIRRRLLDYVATLPPGVPPDPTTVSTAMTKVHHVHDTAQRASRELAATASTLLGPDSTLTGRQPGQGSASFVSGTYKDTAKPPQSAQAFDAQAAHIQQQLANVLAGLVNMSRPLPALLPGIVLRPPNSTPSYTLNPAAMTGPSFIVRPDLQHGPTIQIDWERVAQGAAIKEWAEAEAVAWMNRSEDEKLAELLQRNPEAALSVIMAQSSGGVQGAGGGLSAIAELGAITSEHNTRMTEILFGVDVNRDGFVVDERAIMPGGITEEKYWENRWVEKYWDDKYWDDKYWEDRGY